MVVLYRDQAENLNYLRFCIDGSIERKAPLGINDMKKAKEFFDSCLESYKRHPEAMLKCRHWHPVFYRRARIRSNAG